MSESHRGFCPYYHHAIELVGKRWTGTILRSLMVGAARFHQIRSAIPELSDRMLSERLKELEEEGIVTRTVIPETPVKVEYSLTEKGQALDSALTALGSWAENWVKPEDLVVRQGKKPAA